MCPYHNEEFILKIYSYSKFFKQGSDETFFCIAFARFVSGFSYELIYHAVCLNFTMQKIDNILNNSGEDSQPRSQGFSLFVIWQTSPKSSVHAFDFRDVTERNARKRTSTKRFLACKAGARGHRISTTRRDTPLMLGGRADIGLHTPARERRPCS
jgi:hypothetical protein